MWEALFLCADLDWLVEQKNVCTEDGSLIPGYKVNTRSTDNAALGVVSDRYKVVQNEDMFQFTDDLLGPCREVHGRAGPWHRRSVQDQAHRCAGYTLVIGNILSKIKGISESVEICSFHGRFSASWIYGKQRKILV